MLSVSERTWKKVIAAVFEALHPTYRKTIKTVGTVGLQAKIRTGNFQIMIMTQDITKKMQ
jgi:hypothetical protein